MFSFWDEYFEHKIQKQSQVNVGYVCTSLQLSFPFWISYLSISNQVLSKKEYVSMPNASRYL